MASIPKAKERNTWGRYGVVISALLVFVVSVFMSFDNIFDQRRLIEKESRINVWFLAQLEIEYQRLLASLNLYQIEEADFGKDDLMLRFEIFWSRLPVLLEGEQTQVHRSVPHFETTIRRTLETLKEVEPLIVGLEKGDRAGLFEIREHLLPLGKPLHLLVLDALTIESTATTADREQSEQLFYRLIYLFVGTYAGIVILLFALYRETRRSSRAEQAASTAKAQLIAAIESIADAFVLFDDRDRLVLCNTKFKDFHPGFPEQLLAPGVRFEELVRAEAANRAIAVDPTEIDFWVEARLRGHCNPGDPVECELSDGRWLRISERRTKDGWTVGVETDITELKRREVQLARKRALLEATLQSIDQGISVFDRDLRLMTCNKKYTEMFGLPAEMASVGRPLADFLRHGAYNGEFGAGDRGDLVAEQIQMAEAVANGSLTHRRMERARPDGRSIELTYDAMLGGGVVMAYRDITERVRAEEERTRLMAQFHAAQEENLRLMMEREATQRREAEIRLHDAIESSSEAVILLDADGRIVIANSQAQQFLPEIADLIAPDVSFARVLEEAERRKIFSGSSSILWELGARDAGPAASPVVLEEHLADGRWFRVSRSASREGGAVIIWSDITEIKAREESLRLAKEQAEAASAAKTSFLATMSHELRTPLNAIIGFSEIIAEEMFGAVGQPQYKGYADDIRRSGTHLLDVIGDILDFAKSEDGKLTLNVEKVDASALIETCARMMQEQCTEAQIELCTQVDPSAPPIRADAAKVRQVVLNLVGNARKFTPQGGRITVTLEPAASGIAIAVADTGVGMRPEDIPAALEPFRQLDNSLARRYEGTGLGLPLTKRLIELHGGTLEIESTLGAGTTVTVHLPPGPPSSAPVADAGFEADAPPASAQA